ncbi:hypothetical protein [Rhodococcoides fascians]|uniref:hypothetical protein n=1 Tax=Rhodococcoides fascians TaxID=1828 RepID=UPI000ABCC6C8|nr:hypothetical protein [Rhodococcus fascians]
MLALGVVPVAMPTFDGPQYGSEGGILPWDAKALEDLGGETPTPLTGDGTGAVPVEQFAAAAPDLIFAPYSGLTQGKTVTIALPNAPGTFAVSKDDDVRVEFLEQLGLVNEPTIQEADPAKDPDAVYFELSLEQASLLKSDVLFVVAYDKESLGSFLAEPAVASQPVLAQGRTASTESLSVDKNFAFGGLTVLTIPYILDDVASALNAAAENVQG